MNLQRANRLTCGLRADISRRQMPQIRLANAIGMFIPTASKLSDIGPLALTEKPELFGRGSATSRATSELSMQTQFGTQYSSMLRRYQQMDRLNAPEQLNINDE